MMFSPYSRKVALVAGSEALAQADQQEQEPTPQAMPNMVRNERSLCAQRVPKICAKTSNTICMGVITR
jgi:hypothetical protein